MDFETPGDAEKATHALQAAGIQAQMAKVSKVGEPAPYAALCLKLLPILDAFMSRLY